MSCATIKRSFQLDPASVVDGVLSQTPVFRFGATAGAAQKHRWAALINGASGEFHLKSSGAATTVFRIIFN